MVADAPVVHIAAPGVGQLTDGITVAAGLLHGQLAVLHRQQAVLIGLVVVEYGQQKLGPALILRLLGEGAELLLDLPLLGLVEQAPGVDVVLDALHLLLRGHGEQLVDGDAEVHGDLRQQLHVGDGVAQLPLADGLGGDVKGGGQSLLGDAAGHAQTADFLSHFHGCFLLLVFGVFLCCGLIVAQQNTQNQRLPREFTRAAVELISQKWQGHFCELVCSPLRALACVGRSHTTRPVRKYDSISSCLRTRNLRCFYD